jgi:NADH:ubiquinone oxidoreductase subunit C
MNQRVGKRKKTVIADSYMVQSDTLAGAVAKMKADGHRLVCVTCSEAGECQHELLYHFDKAFVLTELRLTVNPDAPVPSISTIYWAAFLVENEIQDLFGIRFHGLIFDYQQSFYLDPEAGSAPFCRSWQDQRLQSASQDRESTGGKSA